MAVSDRQRRPLPKGQADALASMAMEVLTEEGVAEGELTLSFVDPPEIEDLHVRYMDANGKAVAQGITVQGGMAKGMAKTDEGKPAEKK